ncbi:MAG: hypothetical protein ACFFCD_17775 [Promethearchaeota archaeon]
MSEMENDQEKGFFKRFATFDLVVIAILVGVWYGVQQIWFIGLAAVPAPISWIVSIVVYELLAMTLVLLAATVVRKGGTVFLIFFLHGLLEVVIFPNIFSVIGLVSDVIPGVLIEAFFYITGGYPNTLIKSGIGGCLRSIVFYPFQLLLLTITYPEYVAFVEFFFGVPYGLFIVLNVIVGVIFGFIAGIIGYRIGLKVKEAI